MIKNLIVARYRDGTVLKGTSLDVNAKRPTFHLRTDDRGTLEIKLADLKALFFVKDLTGDPARNDGQKPVLGDPRLLGAKRVAVTFTDGEMIVGLTTRFPPITDFFFLVPVDPKSNNVRVLVNRADVVAMREIAGSAARQA